ncbi:MAG: hypothetical protein ACFFFG_10805 [Candidatus Thorarchaeota archaeon]
MVRDTTPSEKLFEIAPHKLEGFRTLIEILKNIPDDDVIFSISDQGLQVSKMDKRRYMLIILRFPSSFFYSFRSGKNIPQIRLSLEELDREVRFWAGEKETVLFELIQKEAVMRVGASHDIPVTIADGVIMLDPVELELPYLAEIVRKDFTQTMSMFAEVFPEDPTEIFPPGYYAPLHPVTFEGQAQEIHFHFSDETQEGISIRHPIASSGVVQHARNFYPIEYIKKTLILDTRLGDRITLEFGDNTPLRLQHINAEDIELTFLIGSMDESPGHYRLSYAD